MTEKIKPALVRIGCLTDIRPQRYAIEKLAYALDPEHTKPFSGDILDLLEWAEKDVLEMRAEIAELRQQIAEYEKHFEKVSIDFGSTHGGELK